MYPKEYIEELTALRRDMTTQTTEDTRRIIYRTLIHCNPSLSCPNPLDASGYIQQRADRYASVSPVLAKLLCIGIGEYLTYLHGGERLPLERMVSLRLLPFEQEPELIVNVRQEFLYLNFVHTLRVFNIVNDNTPWFDEDGTPNLVETFDSRQSMALSLDLSNYLQNGVVVIPAGLPETVPESLRVTGHTGDASVSLRQALQAIGAGLAVWRRENQYVVTRYPVTSKYDVMIGPDPFELIASQILRNQEY